MVFSGNQYLAFVSSCGLRFGIPGCWLPWRTFAGLDLRHFSRVSVGGTPRKSRASDTFPAFLSEVPLESPGPPTLFAHFCRRYPSKVLGLRHFSRISVGGTPRKSWASDTFPVFLSEVPFESPGPPTLFPCFRRRWAQSSQRQRNPQGSHRLLYANADLCAIFEDIGGVKKPDLRLVWQIMQGPRTHCFYNTLTLNDLRKVSVRGPNF